MQKLISSPSFRSFPPFLFFACLNGAAVDVHAVNHKADLLRRPLFNLRVYGRVKVQRLQQLLDSDRNPNHVCSVCGSAAGTGGVHRRTHGWGFRGQTPSPPTVTEAVRKPDFDDFIRNSSVLLQDVL